MKSLLFSLIFCFFSIITFAQKNEYPAASIADSLKENANAVIRLDQTDITILSQRSMNAKNHRVVTVFNEKGFDASEAYEFYDKSTSVKNIEAIIYDASGKEIKKIKRKDFKDQSVVGGGTLFSDSRYVFLDYTPISYPFTIEFNSEVQTSSTAFIPRWMPLRSFAVSIEKSSLNVIYPNDLGFKKKEFQFSGFNIKKITDTNTQLSYVASNILAQKQEDYSPSYKDLFPKVMMGLERFHLEGVDGTAANWTDFGKWYSEKILAGTTDLPEETKVKIRTIVGDEKDPIKKAKLVYDFVQKKSRYVSIQVGIGGWKPMLAADVDRLGYGDCKALTNYTKALLQAVDVPSYNTVLFGDPYKTNIESDFVSMQGNHMILSIPSGNHYTWLECTSQDDPFGYQGTFTDDRDVLIIKPEGGEIVRTKIYADTGNTQIDKGIYTIDEKGDFSGSLSIISEGSQYSSKARIESMQPTEKERHYKEYWNRINNLKLGKISFLNDKESIRFTENVQLSAVNYATISANKLIFSIDAFNQDAGNVKRIRNRKNPFQIQRGYLDTDEIEINLPAGFSIEFLPSNYELKGKFGEYKTEIIKKENNKLIYKRSMFLNKGKYSNKEYDDYRLFMEQVSRNDNAKIILTKN
ncbi:transglutaminase [Flavobacteriaceae bacterium CRH]|nr:transglutaminase [Flavobacteriaceae bacterium CRH]